MSSSSPAATPPSNADPQATIPDDLTPENADLPLPLSASIVLTSLPHDASTALEKASREDNDGVPAKVTIRFQPVGSAPQLRQRIFKVSSANRFETVVAFLTKKLAAAAAATTAGGGGAGGGGGGGEQPATAAGGGVGGQVFCYVNSVFAPGLDEGVGGLWRCFKTDDQLTVAYSITPAFG